MSRDSWMIIMLTLSGIFLSIVIFLDAKRLSAGIPVKTSSVLEKGEHAKFEWFSYKSEGDGLLKAYCLIQKLEDLENSEEILFFVTWKFLEGEEEIKKFKSLGDGGAYIFLEEKDNPQDPQGGFVKIE